MSRASVIGRTLILLLLSTQLLAAQSLTAGRVEGTLRDAARRPVFDALISLVERSSGARFEATTDRSGSFRIATLPVGRYAFTAEALGYIPLRVLEVTVSAGPVTRLDLTLRTATPPVSTVDTLAGGSGRVQAGGWLLERGYADLVGERRVGSDLSAFSTAADALSIEGLPWRYAAPMLDGALGVTRAAPSGTGAEAGAALLPLRFIAEADVGGLGSDVEVGGSGVGIRASSLLGGRQPASRLLAEAGTGSYGAAFSVSGPLQGDTARALLGGDYQRVERALAEDEALPPRVDERASVNGRFDWQADDRLAITARGSATHIASTGIALREGPMVAAGRSYEMTAAQFLLNARGRITPRLSHEWRLSADVGVAEGDNRGSLRSDIASAPSRLGRAADGRVEQDWLTPRLSGMLHFEWGAHRFKLGFSQAVHRMGSDYLRDGDGVYALGDSAAIAPGGWRRVDGTGLDTDLRVRESAYFLQDAWQVAPGLSLTLGARINGMRLPTGDIEGNGAWLAASGLDNRVVDGTSSSIAPRVGVRWQLGRNGT
ncbi:MAG TPA: TonB-dependent receptor [Gemmatimonadaceae bacterium]|nr:TonB-dependent receptor [Gemmatimonadaceae bacterium]